MRIILFCFNSSGLFHYAYQLALALSQNPRITKVIFVTSKQNFFNQEPSSKKLTVLLQTAPHRPLAFLLWFLFSPEHNQLRRTIQKFNPDIIHITDIYPIYFRLYSLLKYYPVIFTQHDSSQHPGESSLFISLVTRFIQHCSRLIVVHGQSLRQDLITSQPTSKPIHIIPMAAFTHFFPEVSPDIVPQIPGSLLFFGRIVSYKGLDVLLKSVICLQSANLAPTVIIAGPGSLTPYQDLLSQIKNLKIFNYYIPDSQVKQYFNMSEIVVLPHRSATQSAIAALAIAAAKPIIASRTGAIPELLEDNRTAILTKPNDPESLASAIKQLLNNPLKQKTLRLNAFQDSRERLSWNKVSQKYIDLYSSLL